MGDKERSFLGVVVEDVEAFMLDGSSTRVVRSGVAAETDRVVRMIGRV